MKKTAFWGLPVAMLLVLGVLLSCASTGGQSGGQSGGQAAASSAGNDGVPKTLIINGIDGYSGDILVTVASTSSPASSMVAVGGAAVSGGSVTFPLVIPGREDTRWTGTGDYFVVLVFEQQNNAIYFYSGGGMSALRYTFTEATTTIPLSQFRRN